MKFSKIKLALIALSFSVNFVSAEQHLHSDDVDPNIKQQFYPPQLEITPGEFQPSEFQTTTSKNSPPAQGINAIVDRTELLSPVDGSNLGASATFMWSDEGANQYLFTLSTVQCFASDLLQQFGIPSGTTSFTANSLNPDQVIYASIWAQTNAGGSYFSRDCLSYNIDSDDDGIYNELDPNPNEFDPSPVYQLGGYELKTLPTGRVATLKVSTDQYNELNSGNTANLKDLSKAAYLFYKDSFDFIFFTNDQDNSAASYAGRYHSVQNAVQGIGGSIFNQSHSWGSDNEDHAALNDGRLQGVVHYPELSSFGRGPGLHELAHRWGNRLSSIPNGGGHWGFSSGGGQLGGWAPGTLQDLGGDQYQANNGRTGSTSFGTFANGGNGLPYSNIELYVMGMIPFAELGTMQFASNGAFVNSVQGTFSADSITTITPAQLISNEGARNPDSDTAQKHFTILNIIVTTSEVNNAQLGAIDEQAYRFALNADEGTSSFNFWEATGGRGTLDMTLALSELKDGLEPIAPAIPITDEELCVPIKASNGAIALVCL